MASINRLEQQILAHFGFLEFRSGDDFFWSASRREVNYRSAKAIEDLWQLLHEIAHAELGHCEYQKDLHLLQHEAAAWCLASTKLAPLFGLVIAEDFAENQLDSYRDWLYDRSTCPICKQTGIQQTARMYQCINCLCSWLVNEARLKRLRRIKLPDQGRSEKLAAEQLA